MAQPVPFRLQVPESQPEVLAREIQKFFSAL
jgi:hypothetical protein